MQGHRADSDRTYPDQRHLPLGAIGEGHDHELVGPLSLPGGNKAIPRSTLNPARAGMDDSAFGLHLAERTDLAMQ